MISGVLRILSDFFVHYLWLVSFSIHRNFTIFLCIIVSNSTLYSERMMNLSGSVNYLLCFV